MSRLSILVLGSSRVADVRERSDDVAEIAAITKLTPAAVRGRVRRRNGNYLVRTLFQDRWPPRLEELGRTLAREILADPELTKELSRLVHSTPSKVRASLAACPRKRAKACLAEHWPSPEATSVNKLLALSLEDLKRRYDVDEIARKLDVDPSKLKRRLKTAHGRSTASRALSDLLPAPKATPGLLAGRYDVRGPRDPGGMGFTSRAMDRGTNPAREVRLKWAKPGHERSLEKEWEKARTLSHPNIIRYLARAEDEHGSTFLVMEEGGRELEEHAKAASKDWTWIVERLRGVADALDYLHEQARHFHHDVKPKNIVVDKAGTARLIDFGVTTGAGPGGAPTSTVGGYSRMYCSPELERDDSDLRRSDQFSLAVVVLALREGPARVQAERSKAGPLGLAALAGKVGALRRALQVDPQHRFASCNEFIEALAEDTTEGSWFSRWLNKWFN